MAWSPARPVALLAAQIKNSSESRLEGFDLCRPLSNADRTVRARRMNAENELGGIAKAAYAKGCFLRVDERLDGNVPQLVRRQRLHRHSPQPAELCRSAHVVEGSHAACALIEEMRIRDAWKWPES